MWRWEGNLRMGKGDTKEENRNKVKSIKMQYVYITIPQNRLIVCQNRIPIKIN